MQQIHQVELIYLKKLYSSASNEEKETQESWLKEDSEKKEEKLSMPWSDVQDWALRDNLSKYTVVIPFGSEKDDTPQVYALWRTMLKEIPELSGYPIDFLQDMYSKQISKKESPSESKLDATPALLPYLEDYEFASAGGVSGKIYGVPGLADGTRIETSPVTNIEVTLPQGFIRCADGSAAYELGRPKREVFLNAALDDAKNAAASTASRFPALPLLMVSCDK